MASQAVSSGQSSSGQSSNVSHTPIVEVYCTEQMLRLLGWTPDHLNSIRNVVPAGWDSRSTGDGNPFCRYTGSLMDGRGVLRSVAQGALTAFCRFGLPESYVRSQLQGSVYADDADEDTMPTNVILIQRDINASTGQAGPIRGLSLLQVTSRDDAAVGHYGSGRKITSEMLEGLSQQQLAAIRPTIELEVLVLGNAEPPSVVTRNHRVFPNGGLTIRAIQTVGVFLPRGIGLHGLDTVISLYYKYGWRFVNGCGDAYTESAQIPAAVTALYKFHKEVGSADLTEHGEETLQGLLRPFNSYSHHFYSELHQGKEGGEDDEMYGQKEVAKEALESAQDNGFRMLLCQRLNIMFYIVTGQQPPLNADGRPAMPSVNRATRGGRRRRRRKRTKKRALKKKHRRTRRRRKRKTRRKRRGGKHKKPSRKHCKKLRHQHRQLAHGLHRVSQAINVQCGMRGGVARLTIDRADAGHHGRRGGNKSCIGARDGISGCRTCCGADSGPCVDNCMN